VAPPSPDVVIIGAGAVGALCALEAAERGLRVLVLDSGDPCRGTSGATFSWAAAHSKEPIAYHRFSHAAIRLHPGLSERLGVDLEWRPCFSLYAELDPEGYAQRKAATTAKIDAGFGLRWLEGDRARALVPQLTPGVLGASLCEGEGTLNAFRLVLGALHAAQQRGAVVRVRTPVIAIERDGRGVRGVRTATERVACRRVVLAAGHGGGALLETLGLALPLQRVKGELLVTEPWHERLPGVVADVQQTPSGNLLLGVTWEPERHDLCSSARNLRATAQRACRVLPFLEQVRVIRSFVGVRPVPHDMVSYLGPTRHAPGLIVALTHSGITLAPLLGEVVADAIEGRVHPAWHVSFSPDRALEAM
jgi:glycine/D-amino acid oxidase-like deaminating enzyme